MDKRKRGNIFSSTAAMIQGNLDAFWRTPRTLLMMVFIACCCFLTVRGYATGLARKNYTMNMEESIAWFLMTGFNSFNLTSVTFLIMVSELPLENPFSTIYIDTVNKSALDCSTDVVLSAVGRIDACSADCVDCIDAHPCRCSGQGME